MGFVKLLAEPPSSIAENGLIQIDGEKDTHFINSAYIEQVYGAGRIQIGKGDKPILDNKGERVYHDVCYIHIHGYENEPDEVFIALGTREAVVAKILRAVKDQTVVCCCTPDDEETPAKKEA